MHAFIFSPVPRGWRLALLAVLSALALSACGGGGSAAPDTGVKPPVVNPPDPGQPATPPQLRCAP